MTGKNKALWINSGVGVALVGSILIAANVLASFVHFRLDFSRGQVYSISAASRHIVASLPDPVLVNVYYSKELPPQVAVTKNYLLDLLREYVSGSNGKLRLRLSEIGDDPSSKEEATRAGIAPVQFDIISKDKYEQREGFLGLTLQYQDKKDVIGYLQSTTSLEYELTSRIKALSTKKKPVLGFVSNHQALSQEKLDPAIADKLRTRFDLRDVDIGEAAKGKAIDPDIKSLLFVGPEGKVPANELAVLDQFLQSGGSLGLAVDGKRIMQGSYIAMDADAGFGDFLKSRGIELLPTIVLDAQCIPIQISRQAGPIVIQNVVKYPPILLVKDLNDSHPITQRLEGLIMPFASPLKVSAPAQVLASSSKFSWAKRPEDAHFLQLDPFKMKGPDDKDLRGPFALAAAVQNGSSRLVVVGSTQFAGTPDFKAPDANLSFLLNMADWLSQDVDLIAIRSKAVTFRPLKEVSPSSKRLIRYADFFLPPLLAILVGLIVWRRRETHRQRMREEFAPTESIAASV